MSKPRGFAAMTPERRREIAVRGGKAAQAGGKARRWTTEQAREAGRKGGLVTGSNHDHMVELGRKGGKARHRTVQHG